MPDLETSHRYARASGVLSALHLCVHDFAVAVARGDLDSAMRHFEGVERTTERARETLDATTALEACENEEMAA
ncbi:MAG: hypothetical protein WBF53_06380 [Litorimonas sp.]